MIKGFFVNESPILRLTIAVPRRTASVAHCDALIDTGSTLTVLRRSVLGDLGLDPDRDLADRPRDQGTGVGGTEEYVRVRARLSFPDDADSAATPLDFFVRVALADDQPRGLPSLVGMDLLSGYRVVVSAPEGLVSLERLLIRPLASS